jgi:glycosyltransferase involved in cell wall biosynthesis
MWNFVVTFGSAAARRARVPYVLAPRGMLSDACLRQSSYPLKRAFARAYDHRTVEGASRLHFLNHDEYLASQNDWFRYPPYFLARNGIDLNLKGVRPGMFRERYPELGGRRIMLFLGRLHAIKRLDLQLQALPQLLAEFPDLIWVLVGPDDGEWPRLKSLIDKAGLAAHVKWVGSIVSEERFSGLLDADVVVQTSFYECQSTTVNEALAVGAPLVVTDSINYGEVQASGAGYVVCSEPVELGQAIAAVLRAPDAAALMRRAGQRFAKEELAWTRIARTVSDAYVEIKSLRSEACEAWPNTSDASTART